jgi:hypothetical protein
LVGRLAMTSGNDGLEYDAAGSRLLGGAKRQVF